MKQTLLVKQKYKGKFVRAYRFRGSQITVGSVKNSRVHLLGGQAAGLVCLIQKGKNGWQVLDLGSEPDVKIDHKPFTEHEITSRSILQIGENVLEMQLSTKNRKVFTPDYNAEKGSAKFFVARWNDNIIDTSFEVGDMQLYKSPRVEVTEHKVLKRKEISKEDLTLPPELRKPLGGSAAAILVFLLLLFGIPGLMPPTVEKPKDNVYTRMIFDSKILAEKKKQLQSSGTKLLKGSGGSQQVMAGMKKGPVNDSKAVASLRAAGITSIISKIAKQASKNAMLVARLAAMPNADASLTGQQLNGFGQIPTTQGRSGKADIMSGTGGFKVGAIGTAGKGGGKGGYKNGSALGDGGVGHGDIAIDDTESIVEGGLDKEAIAKVIREHLGQIRYCYDRQLASDSELHGKVKVKWNIDAEGIVESQSLGESTMNNAMVEECILRRIATWKFPKPKGGTKVLVSYPFLFKSVN